MKKLLIILMTSVISISTGYATAQNQTTNEEVDEKQQNDSDTVRLNIPVYAQKISIGLPNQFWRPVFEQKNPNYRIEFVPNNEDRQDWVNLISIQGIKDFVKQHYSSENKSASLLALSMLQFKNIYEQICPKDKFVFNPGGKVDINTKKYIGFIIGCLVPGKVKPEEVKINKGELGYYIIIEGNKDLYIIHKAVRGSESFLTKELNAANVSEFISSIEPIKLCKTTGHIAECQQ